MRLGDDNVLVRNAAPDEAVPDLLLSNGVSGGGHTVIRALQSIIFCSSARTNTEEELFSGKSTWRSTASTGERLWTCHE